MSEPETSSSAARSSTPQTLTPSFVENIKKFERFKKESGAAISTTSTSRDEHSRPKSSNGQPLRWSGIETQGWNQSPTRSGFVPQFQRNGKFLEYSNIWRGSHTLSLDGGGVRGYSQLIILKALMDEVARIERSKPDDKGNLVESSFHPFSPADGKSAARPKVKQRKTRKKKTRSQNSGNSGTNNGKGKEIEGQSVSSSSSYQECGNFYPYHYFDYIAGTSTGGLNAIMLGRLRMSVEECLNGYADMASRVFGKPRIASYRFSPLFWFCAKYSGNRLRDVVKDVVDEHLCNQEGYMLAMNKEMCRTVVLAMKKNHNGHEMAHLFRTYDHLRRAGTSIDRDYRNPMEQQGPADSSLIWEVARATSAAPTYFDTIKIGEDEYGDAGFGENNPSKRLFWEVSHMNNNDNSANELSVSIGTGITRFSRFQKGSLKRLIGWINAAKKVSTDCEQAHVEMQAITVSGQKYKYFRFNVPEKATDPDAEEESKWQHVKKRSRKWFGHGGEPLDRGLGKIKLDEWKSKGWWRKESTQEEIERITKEYLKDPMVVTQLTEIAEKMVSHRRARAKTDRWESYALGIRYACPTYEPCPDDTWTTKSDLRRHLIEYHQLEAGNTKADERLEKLLKKGQYFEDHH